MVFNSTEFLFLFLPITLIGYFTLNNLKSKNISKLWLVLCSLFFYGYYNKWYLFIISSSVIVNFIIGNKIHSYNCKNLISKIYLLIGITFNLLLLGYFKYYDFFVFNLNKIFITNLKVLNIILPLGISFFTFQQLSFLIDSYKGSNIKYNFLDYCLFVTFFPQLIAGPIVLPSEMLPQFEDNFNKKINYENMSKGLYLLSIGLVKKVFIADTLAILANSGFNNPNNLTMMDSILTSFGYTFQLYFDFSGYCDIAMGIAFMFNIKLPLNFNSPYKSTNIKEFWNNWHITLGRFLTNYIYYPLGGSKLGKTRTLLNLFIVFFISGIWHGAGWPFILWGCLHGFAIIIHRLWTYTNKKLPKILGWFITFNIVNILWVFFRANNITTAFKIIKSMFNISTLYQGFSNEYLSLINPNLELKFCLIIAIIIALFAPKSNKIVNSMKFNLKTNLIIIFYLTLSIFIILSNKVSTFLYFNF